MNPPPTFTEFPVDDPFSETHPRLPPPARSSSLRPTVSEALKRNWLLVIAPAIALAVAGVAFAFARPATYTAQARVLVGKANPTSPAFGGFVTAASGLAAVYSRSINTPGIIDPVGRKLGWSSGLVNGRLSATPIPNSPIITVIGTAPSAADAEKVANAGAAQLTSYVTHTNRVNPDATRLYAQYQAVARQKARNNIALSQATRTLNQNPNSTAAQNAVANDTATAGELGVRLNALGAAYNQAEASQAATDVLAPLSHATSAASNRSSKVQTIGGAGLLAGLVIGVALAMWRANLLMRRRFAA